MHKLSNKLYLNTELLTSEQIRAIKKAFVFQLKQDEFIQLFETLGKWLIVPPNVAKVEQAIGKFEYEDQTVATKAPTFKHNIQLRDHQKVMESKLEASKYHAILGIPTGGGKTVTSIYFMHKLGVYSLFIGAQLDHIQSFVMEVKEKVENWQEVLTVIDGNWDGTLTPIMVASTALLRNRDSFVKILSDNVGLLIADEVHKNFSGDQTYKLLTSFKPKHRIYMSGTFEHKADGLAEAIFSANVILGEEASEHTITVVPVKMEVPDYVFGVSFKSWDKLLKAYYTIPEFALGVAEVIHKLVNGTDRSVLCFNTTKAGQETIVKACERVGVTVALINSETPKAEREQIKKDFELGKIRVIVGGVSITASLSLYKASTIIQTDISTPKNDLIQLLGRLKRKKAEICDKDKVLIDLIHGPLAYKRYKRDRVPAYMEEAAKKEGMIKMLKERTAVDYNIAKAIGLS